MYRLLLPLTLCVALSGLACASASRQTPLMAVGSDIKVTTSELRLRVYDYESWFAATVETSADAILDAEEDPAIQESALRWKINAIAAMQRAAFQADPLAALGDCWGLTIQMSNFFEDGAGKDLFGDSHRIAVQASQDLEVEVERIAPIVATPGSVARVKADLTAWAQENPIQDLSFGRRMATIDAAAVTAAELGGGEPSAASRKRCGICRAGSRSLLTGFQSWVDGKPKW